MPGFNPIRIYQTKPDGSKVFAYSPDTLKNLTKIGIKLAPTYANSVQFNIHKPDLFTKEELATFSDAKQSIIKLIYLDDQQKIWNVDRIRKESWRFEGVRALPGKTYVIDPVTGEKKGPYMLCILDIDSVEAYNRCKPFFDDWLNNTWVTKTRKGWHIYWLENWTDDNDFVSIESDDCKSKDVAFEVFVSPEYTQILGSHREDPNFQYTNVGCKNLQRLQLAIRDGQYNNLVNNVLGYLLKNPDKIKELRRIQKKSKDPLHSPALPSEGNYSSTVSFDTISKNSRKLEDWQINAVINWAFKFYGNDDHYFHFSKAFLSVLVREYVNDESIARITDNLCKERPSRSYTFDKWLGLVKNTFDRVRDGLSIWGQPKLKEGIQYTTNCTENAAWDHVNELIQILQYGKKSETELVINNTGSSQEADERYNKKLVEEEITQEDLDHVIRTMTKEAENDQESIRQLFHAFNTAFTKFPTPHTVNTLKAGSGKNYLVNKIVASYYPQRYIIEYNKLSDKALFHRPGIEVIA